MATRNKETVPFMATHPGEILSEELKERGIKQKDFAQTIGIQASHLNEFIKGKRNLTDNLALQLEKHLGIPYTMWMNLQTCYNNDTKAIERRNAETNIVNLRLPAETYNRLSLAAENEGTTINAFIRNVLNRAVVL